MNRKTYIIERCYPSGNGWMATIKGFALPFMLDEKLPEGTAVVISGLTARRPS